MNFTNMMGQKEVAMELKYCERCGGLWLRRLGQDAVHCGRCRAQIVAMLRGRGRAPKRIQAGSQVQIECLQGVAAMEVHP
jgi:DNA-directed RNA polymerase subunit RPC12/RpoP